jgi:probable RNA-binding protein EIF1AD
MPTGKPRRLVQATALATTTPPDTLSATQSLAKVLRLAGNNLYEVSYPSTSGLKPSLVELPARFRNAIWLKRGSFVVIDTEAFAERENKLGGEIVNVVREEREWRKMAYWPKGDKEFMKKVDTYGSDGSEDEGESRVGRMPTPEEEDD